MNHSNMTKAVIPAAGFGTRILPLSKITPKEMLPVFNKPVIQHAVEECIQSGITDILIIISKGKEDIDRYFRPHDQLQAQLQTHHKNDILRLVLDTVPSNCHIHLTYQDAPKGLGHAIYCAHAFVGDDAFAVLLPDDVILTDPKATPCIGQLIEAYAQHPGHICAAMHVPDAQLSRYGVFKKAAPMHDYMGSGSLFGVDDVVEKPAIKDAPSNHAIVGRYVFQPSIFGAIKATKKGAGGEIQITDAIKQFCDQGKVFGFEFSGKRYDTGHYVGLLEASLAFGLADPDYRDQIIDIMKHFMVP